MKKYKKLFAILAFVPLLIFSGCGSTAYILETQTTNKTATSYLYNYSKDIVAFQNLVKGDSEKNIPGYTSSISSNNEAVLSSSVWGNINLTNKEFLFALSAYDMYIDEKSSWYYDLSFVDGSLKDFFLQDISTQTIFKYLAPISGTTPNSLVPTTDINASTYQTGKDTIDDTIISWGNNLQFTAKYYSNTLTYHINASTAFAYPSEEQVPEDTTSTDVKIYRFDNQQTIAIVYKNASNNIFTKEVCFNSVDSDGNTRKIVKCFAGNKVEDTTIEMSSSYEYVFSTTSLLGNYEILYNEATSYFQGKHTISTGVYRCIETYLLKSDYILAEYDFVNKTQTSTIQYIISGDASSAILKYKTNHKNISYISNFERINQSTFARITSEEKQSTSKVIEFIFANGTITSNTLN